MSEYIYSFFYTVLYVVMCNLFIGIFFHIKRMQKVHMYCVQLTMVVVNYLISYIFKDEIILRQPLVILTTSVFMFILYRINYITSLITTIIYQGSGIIIEYLTIVILQKSFHFAVAELVSNSMLSYALGLLCQMIMFCLILFVRKVFVRDSGVLLTQTEWIRFSIFPVFSIISIISMILNFDSIQNSRQGTVLVCVVTGIMIMNVLLFGLLNDALRREKKLSEYSLVQERGKNETEMYKSMLEHYDEQRKMIHEFRNCMSCIRGLAQREEYGELKKYLSTMQESIKTEPDLIDTNKKLVNVILNTKYHEAKAKGIVFVLKSNDLSQIKIGDQDIVILLSNLLNNAFEACDKCEEKIVRIKLMFEDSQLILSVANTYKEGPIKTGGRFITRKSECRELHGIGIENIKEIVEKYKGDYAIKYDAQYFKFTILIPD